MFDIQENLKKLPDSPGVYIHRDKLGDIIYVGKAISLRNRVRQYFQSSRNMDPKVRSMVSQIAEFEYIRTGSEVEALILECNLIKKHRPKYNILLRDDKTYPYIKITKEPYPRVIKTRIVKKDGGRYFGPYSDAGAVNKIVDLLNSTFSLKRCSAAVFPPGFRPCLNYHIHQCRGICIGQVDQDTYAKAVQGAAEFLSGHSKKLQSTLKEKMQAASEALNFEEAAIYRDYLEAAASLAETQRVVMHHSKEADIVVPVRGKEEVFMAVFFVREGKLIGRETYAMDTEMAIGDIAAGRSDAGAGARGEAADAGNCGARVETTDDEIAGARSEVEGAGAQDEGDKAGNPGARAGRKNAGAAGPDGGPAAEDAAGTSRAALISAFIQLHYGQLPDIPKEILVPCELPEQDVLQEFLTQQAGHNVQLHFPQRGEKRALVELARRDALEMIRTVDERVENARQRRQTLGQEIYSILRAMHADSVIGDSVDPQTGLPGYDGRQFRAEAYDISNTNGVDTVGAMVTFQGLKADRKGYRKFRIRTVEGQDDYASMTEVLSRRFARVFQGDDAFSVLPDIIFMDGGKGHVTTALEVIDATGLEIPVVGMVKDDHHRTRALIYREHGSEEFAEIPLADKPLLFSYIGRMQEEVHRFAIDYHRKVRSQRVQGSVLDEIPGIGAVRRNALLEQFRSVDAIRNIALSENGEDVLADADHMDRRAAKSICEFFRGRAGA